MGERYGPWEIDRESPPIYREFRRGVLYPYPQARRKVYEFWTENGQRMGRWWWEHAR